MRSILVFLVALAVLGGALVFGARFVAPPPASRVDAGAGDATPNTKASRTPRNLDGLTAIDVPSAGKIQVGEMIGGRFPIYRETIRDGRRKLVQICDTAYDQASVRASGDIGLTKPSVAYFDDDGKTVRVRLEADVGSLRLPGKDGRPGVVDLTGHVVARAPLSSEDERVVFEMERLSLTLASSESRKIDLDAISTDSPARVYKEGEGLDLSGTGISARAPFDEYEISRDVVVTASGAPARALGGAGSAERVTIRSAGGLRATRAEPGPSGADRRLLTFEGPVAIECGPARQTAKRMALLLERVSPSGEKLAYLPVELKAEGGVTIKDPRLEASASSMRTSFVRDSTGGQATIDETTLDGSPRGSIFGVGVGTEVGTLEFSCRGRVTLRSPSPQERTIEAADGVRVDLPASGSKPTTLTAGALAATLRGADSPTLQSIVASQGARIESADVVAQGRTIRRTAPASKGSPEVLEVEGEPRLEIADGASFRSELLLDDGAMNTSDPVIVMSQGPLRVESFADTGEEVALFRDRVIVSTSSKTDPFELRSQSLRLRTRKVEGKSEMAELRAEGEIEIQGERLRASGDALQIHPARDATRRALVLTGKPASVTLRGSRGRSQDIRALTLTATELPSAGGSPESRRLKAKGAVHATFSFDEPAAGEREGTRAEWGVDAPEAFAMLQRGAKPEEGFELREFDAQGGVALTLDANEAHGGRFTFSQDRESARGVLAGEAGLPASLLTWNEYDSSRRDTASAPEFDFVAEADPESRLGKSLNEIRCPKGGEFTFSAPAEDLPGVAPRSEPGKFPRLLQRTTIACKGPATFLPGASAEFTGGFAARTEGGSKGESGLLEGDSLSIAFLKKADGLRRKGEIAGATARGSAKAPAHLKYRDLDGVAETIELDASADWVVFTGKPARVSSRMVSETATFIRYNRRTGELESKESQTDVRSQKKKS